MQGISQQCDSYINELQCPPSFIAVMLSDVADAFEISAAEGESSCDCC